MWPAREYLAVQLVPAEYWTLEPSRMLKFVAWLGPEPSMTFQVSSAFSAWLPEACPLLAIAEW